MYIYYCDGGNVFIFSAFRDEDEHYTHVIEKIDFKRTSGQVNYYVVM